jgi:tetratricopeptide (TPR) repeat protein
VAAGSAALTALAHLDDAEPELLSAIAAHFPERRSADLDTGMAMLTAALASHQLASTDDPVEQAAIHFGMGYRHSHAGLREQVLAAMSEAATIYRRLAAERPSALMSLDLATALTDMGALLAEQGRPEEALSATREATGIYRALTAQDPPSAPVEARRLSRQSCDAADAGGDTEEALTAAAECANIYRSLAAEDPAAFEPDLAQALAVLGRQLARAARWKQALLANTEAAQIYRRLTAEDPAAFTPDLAKALTSLGTRLSQVRRLEEAILPTREAVGIHRRLAAKNPAAFEPELALSLANLGIRLSNRAATWRMRLRHRRQARGLQEEALLATGEAVDICRRLAVADPEAFVQDLARSLWSFAWVRVASDLEVAQAVEAAHESVTLCQSLVERLPGVFTAHIRALAGLVVPSPPMATHRRRQLCGPAFVPCHWGEAGGSHFVGRPSAPTSPAAGAGSAAGTDPVGRSAAQKLQ